MLQILVNLHLFIVQLHNNTMMTSVNIQTVCTFMIISICLIPMLKAQKNFRTLRSSNNSNLCAIDPPTSISFEEDTRCPPLHSGSGEVCCKMPSWSKLRSIQLQIQCAHVWTLQLHYRPIQRGRPMCPFHGNILLCSMHDTFRRLFAHIELALQQTKSTDYSIYRCPYVTRVRPVSQKKVRIAQQ